MFGSGLAVGGESAPHLQVVRCAGNEVAGAEGAVEVESGSPDDGGAGGVSCCDRRLDADEAEVVEPMVGDGGDRAGHEAAAAESFADPVAD